MNIVCFLFVGTLSFAQGPDFRPPGWDNGEKRGWHSDVPPGLGKKSGIDNNSDETSDGEVSGDNDKNKDRKNKKKKKKK